MSNNVGSINDSRINVKKCASRNGLKLRSANTARSMRCNTAVQAMYEYWVLSTLSRLGAGNTFGLSPQGFEAICLANTRGSVSSVIQTPRISSKILRCASYFQLNSRCLDLPVKHCLSCLPNILLQSPVEIIQKYFQLLNDWECSILCFPLPFKRLSMKMKFKQDVYQSIRQIIATLHRIALSWLPFTS